MARAVFYGWGLIGSVSGALSILRAPKNQIAGALVMGALSCLVMVAMLICFRFPLNGIVYFDIGSAAILGAILRPFLQFLHWFEKQSGQPRFVLASWLTISVLIGNFLVPVIGGVARKALEI